MNFINVKPDLLDAAYWLTSTSFKYELTSPTSSQGGLDLFMLKSTKVANVKQVLSLTKPITIGGTKTSVIEGDFNSIECGFNMESFRTSDLFKAQDEDTQTNLTKYMQRIVGALSTIESATLNASQSTGEGTDTSAFSSEEAQARVRLQKAARRLKNEFAKITKSGEVEFTPAYLEKDIPDEAGEYMEHHTFAF